MGLNWKLFLEAPHLLTKFFFRLVFHCKTRIYYSYSNMAAVIVWTIPAIIGVVSSAIGLAQSSVFMMGAIIGMENNDRGKKELPEELGKPWTVWMQAGLDGSSNTSNPDDPHLIGAAGPFPDIYLL